MRKPTILLFSACSILAMEQVFAQSSGAIQQVDSVQQRRQAESFAGTAETGETAPELFPGESDDAGPQSILRYRPRPTHFEAMGDAQYFYTDNMFLAEHGKESADVLVGTVQFALAPTPYELGGGRFAPRIGYRHQWYSFGALSDKEVTVFDFSSSTSQRSQLDAFDFNAQTVFTDARWTFGNWVAGAGFDFTRLLDSSDYNQFYREYVPRWSLLRLFPVSETKTLSLGYEGAYRLTDADLPPPGIARDFNDRTDHSLVAAYTQAICRNALVQPYYRFRYTRFTVGGDRNDYLHSFGVALYCLLTPQINLRAFVGYDIMETSSPSVQDYKKLDAGGGLNLTVRF
jgi:hypothetical protein